LMTNKKQRGMSIWVITRRKSIPKANGLINIDTWGFFSEQLRACASEKRGWETRISWGLKYIYNIHNLICYDII
jgi:hypothetical protein